MPIAFISYSSQDKHVAHIFASALRTLGLTPFLAHDDIAVATSWREALLRNLRSCEVFVPLISRDFRESEWCSMEVGYVLAMEDVIVLPYSLDGTWPYGFLSAIQGGYIDLSASLNETAILKSLRNALRSNGNRILTHALIENLGSFTAISKGRTYIDVLGRQRKDLTPEEALFVAQALTKNSNIVLSDRKFANLVITTIRAMFRDHPIPELEHLIKLLEPKKTEAVNKAVVSNGEERGWFDSLWRSFRRRG